MSTCCTSIFSVPGPTGPPGDACTPCADGINAFTLIDDAALTMPGNLANRITTVLDNRAFSLGQPVYLQNAGSMQVAALNGNGTGITLTNLADGADLYPGNIAPGTPIADQSKLSPAGLQGPQGVSAVTIPVPIAQGGTAAVTVLGAQTSLGLIPGANVQAWSANLDTLAAVAVTAAGTALLDDANAAAQRSTLGLGTIATQNANAASITGGSITGITDLAVTDGGTGASSAAAARTNLGVLSGYGLLGEVIALNLNSGANDTSFTIASSRYLIDRVTLESPSAAVTTATAGLFTAAGGAGVTLCANQALAGALTAVAKILNLTTQAIVGTDRRTETTLYARVGTAEGVVRTVNMKIFGWKYD